MRTIRPQLAAVGAALASLSLTAWVGGHAALGVYGARIAFRDLPRPVASSLMTTVFRSFDDVITAGVVALVVAVGLMVAGRGGRGIADRVAIGAALALCAIGVLELAWIHPTIEQMFVAGQTLEPRFETVHHLSERCAHFEVLLTICFFGAQAARRPS